MQFVGELTAWIFRDLQEESADVWHTAGGTELQMYQTECKKIYIYKKINKFLSSCLAHIPLDLMHLKAKIKEKSCY